MGCRPLTKVAVTKQGKRVLQKWTKGPYAWRSYDTVYRSVQSAAKGLLSLDGIAEQRCAYFKSGSNAYYETPFP